MMEADTAQVAASSSGGRRPVSSDDPQPKNGPIKVLTLPPPHESVFRYANKSKKRTINRNIWWRVLLRVLFSHVGLFLIVCGWATFGAWLFVRIEKPEEMIRIEKRKERAQQVNDSIQYLSQLFWYYQEQNFTIEKWKYTMYGQLKEFEEFILESVAEFDYKGSSSMEEETYSWELPNSLLFTISLMSTIGYGHIAPETQLGKLTVILYSIIGIPLLLLFLANVGDAMANAFTYSYSRFCCHWCRIRRKKSEYRALINATDEYKQPPVPRVALREVALENVGTEIYMPTDNVLVPILLNLMLIAAFILIGAGLFANWEGWDLLSAAYFTFVTLSTIGLGDLVPEKSFNATEDGFTVSKVFQLLISCLYTAFGMALVSMCISLMQEQIVGKVRWLATEVGLVKQQQKPPRQATPTTNDATA